MDVVVPVFIGVFSYVTVKGVSVPPAICFEQFKWQDCGMAPKPVLYYYKSGSRCEVGMWRGCLPNPNMFVDEYECVQTCIFTARAQPEDFHNFQAEVPQDIDDYLDTTTDMTTTGTGGTLDGNTTEATGSEASEGGTATAHEGEAASEAPAAEGDAEAPKDEGPPAEVGASTPVEDGDAGPAEGSEAPPAEGGEEPAAK